MVQLYCLTTVILRLCRSCGIFECSFTRSKRTYKRHVPICRRNASRKAARRRTPSLTERTSDCAVWARSWRIKRSGTSREMSLSMRVLLVARNELAIVTKSIAFALSPATRSPWVPSNLCRGGTAIGKTPEERGKFYLEYLSAHLACFALGAIILFPFDCRRWFARYVVANAAYAFDFVDDTRRHFGEQVIREASVLRSHKVGG